MDVFYLLFSLDSGSKMSLDVDMVKASVSKSGKYKKEQLRSKDIKIDDDFYKGMDDKILKMLYMPNLPRTKI